MSKNGTKTSYLVFCLFFLTSINSFAQEINETRYTYRIFNIESEYEVIQWSIHNNTDEKILLWFEKDTVLQKMPIKEKVRRYFFFVKGDFSLVNVIYEYGSTLMGFKSILFHSFYKIIEPQKTFSIQLICKIPNDKDVVKSLKEAIIMTTPIQMGKEQLNIFMINGLERPAFQPDVLVINGQDIYVNL